MGGRLALHEEPRVLTPATSAARPFPRWSVGVLLAGFVLAIPASPNGGAIARGGDALAKIMAVLAMCGIATWAEQRLYQGLLDLPRVKRVLLTLFVPFLVLCVVLPVSTMLTALATVVGDDGTLAMAAFLGSGWMASAAVGTSVMVIIDVVISSLVPDFRSRVQLAVMTLVALAVASALAVYGGAMWLISYLREEAPTMRIGEGDVLTVGDRVLTGEAAREVLMDPDFVTAVGLGGVALITVLMLPAVLSACGKLADGVMERLNPLAAALASVSEGKLAVRVEEAGSRDFVKINRGFNEMARSLTETLVDLDERNQDLSEMNRASSRFVPFQFLQLLDKESIRHIARGDQIELDMSVMFADIRGFTTMAEAMGPEATFAFINRYLEFVEAPIHGEGGFISEFLGDGVMALFHEGADAAVRAALGMLDAVARFNVVLADEGSDPVAIGIGMNSGTLMLGTIGGQDRLSCSVIGDPANTAARVEGMTKLYGAALLISQGTYERLEDPTCYEIREIDRVQAKGKTTALLLYEVLDALPATQRDKRNASRAAFGEAMARYRAGALQEAQRAFERIVADDPDDVAAALYVDRCTAHLARGVTDWDGVTRLEQK